MLDQLTYGGFSKEDIGKSFTLEGVGRRVRDGASVSARLSPLPGACPPGGAPSAFLIRHGGRHPALRQTRCNNHPRHPRKGLMRGRLSNHPGLPRAETMEKKASPAAASTKGRVQPEAGGPRRGSRKGSEGRPEGAAFFNVGGLRREPLRCSSNRRIAVRTSWRASLSSRTRIASTVPNRVGKCGAGTYIFLSNPARNQQLLLAGARGVMSSAGKVRLSATLRSRMIVGVPVPLKLHRRSLVRCASR